jgi:hypothetical protein
MHAGVAQGLDFAHTTEVAILSGEWNRDYTLVSQNATAFPGSREKIVSLPLADKLAPQRRAALLFLIRGLRALTGGDTEVYPFDLSGDELFLPERQKPAGLERLQKRRL